MHKAEKKVQGKKKMRKKGRRREKFALHLNFVFLLLYPSSWVNMTSGASYLQKSIATSSAASTLPKPLLKVHTKKAFSIIILILLTNSV